MLRLSLALALLTAPPVLAQEALFRSYLDGGRKAYDEGDFAQADKLFKLAAKEAERFKAGDVRQAEPANWAANLLQTQFRYAEAAELRRQTLAATEKANGPTHPAVGNQASGLGNLYLAVGRPDLAEPFYRRALEVKEKQQKPQKWEAAQALRDLGGCLAAAGRNEEAEAALKQALAKLEGEKGREYQVGFALAALAKVYVATGRPTEAEAMCRQALAIYARPNGHPVPVNKCRCQTTLGDALAAAGKPSEAAAAYQSALHDVANWRALAESAEIVLPALTGLAKQLRAAGKAAEAGPLEKRASDIQAKHDAARAKLPK